MLRCFVLFLYFHLFYEGWILGEVLMQGVWLLGREDSDQASVEDYITVSPAG